MLTTDNEIPPLSLKKTLPNFKMAAQEFPNCGTGFSQERLLFFWTRLKKAIPAMIFSFQTKKVTHRKAIQKVQKAPLKGQ